MTDDLLKRLRDRADYSELMGWDNFIFGEAANRIEELEGTIRQIVFDAIQLARAALEGEHD